MSSNFHIKDNNKYNAPRRRQIYEGQDKILYEGTESGTSILYFKDETSRGEGPCIATNNQKGPVSATATVVGKGSINNRFSELMLSRLTDIGVPTHFIKRINMREQLIKNTEVIPFQISLHNYACDFFSKRLGLEEGSRLPTPIIEFSLKSRDLRFPIINQQYICSSGWADEEELDYIQRTIYRVNDFLNGQFIALGIQLMSFTLEFGRLYVEDSPEPIQIMIIDEISPNTCHLKDLKTGKRIDKSIIDEKTFDGSGDVYKNLAERFGLFSDGGPADLNAKIVKKG